MARELAAFPARFRRIGDPSPGYWPLDHHHHHHHHDHHNQLLAPRRRSMLCTIFRIPLIIPILLVATLLTAGFLLMAESTPSESHWRFSIVPGYFLQSEPTTDAGSFDYVSANFGLIPRPYDSDPEFDPEGNKTQWERFEHQVRTLNRDAEPDTAYKVLFLGRHGQGYHNVAEAKYGTELWDCYWSLLDGDENGTWVDARLTPLGISQAQTAHSAWKTQLAHKIPTPESYYVSPLNRCLATANHTFSGLGIPHTDPFRPLIKELLRETIGQHTCDGRSTKSAIEAEYPLYRIEPGFAEADPLYDARLRESDSARDKRFRDLFQDLFSHDGNTFLSLTAHSGAITSMLQITGHRAFALETGGVIPIFVKAERVAGALPPMHVEPWFPPPVCKGGAVPGSG